jgi:hypothetical protein
MRDARVRIVKSPWAFMLALLLACALGCSDPAPVVQGQVVSADAASKTIAVQDEKKPGGQPLAFDVSMAEMGVPPVPGDLVRLAYRVVGDKNVALRVMNLTHERDRGH